MSELINNLLELMSPETVKTFKDLNFKSSSELATEELNGLEDELDNINLNTYEKELDARLAMEEREIRLFQELNKTLFNELDAASKLIKSFENPANSVSLLKTKVELYKKKIDVKSTFNNLDVCGMVDLYSEIEKKEKVVNELEERLSKFSGLPPHISKAKDTIRSIKSEIEILEASANNDLEEEVANYIS